MTRTVVAGVDGSRESLAAADWAAREARRRGVPLSLVHGWVWEPLDLPIAQDEEAQRQLARRLVDEAEARVRDRHPGLAVTAELVEEPPVPVLAGRSEEAELLVLGSRGHGPVIGFLLGSVGLRVLGRAECPVVMVRDGGGGAGAAAAGDEVVVGVQETGERAEPLLSFAFGAAAARGARLRAVRAWSPPTVFTYSPAAMRLADEAGGIEAHEKKLLADTLAPWRARYPDVPVTEYTEIGSAPEVLLTSLSRARLVVVGRRGRPGRGRNIGPVAHAVLHHADAPVAVVALS